MFVDVVAVAVVVVVVVVVVAVVAVVVVVIVLCEYSLIECRKYSSVVLFFLYCTS